jgi:hypothetical protein
VISKFVILSELFRQPTHVKQDVIGKTWDDMLFRFRQGVSHIYREWYQYLRDSLESDEDAYFVSIIRNTASLEDIKFMDSLKTLSRFLARKSRRKVIVLIDEYDAPISVPMNTISSKKCVLHIPPYAQD